MKNMLELGYGINPKAVWKSNLSHKAKVVFMYFLSYTGGGKEAAQKCWPTIMTIQYDTGLCRNHVIEGINELERIGWINKGKLYPDDKLKTHNIYNLTVIENMADITSFLAERQHRRPPQGHPEFPGRI